MKSGRREFMSLAHRTMQSCYLFRVDTWSRSPRFAQPLRLALTMRTSTVVERLLYTVNVILAAFHGYCWEHTSASAVVDGAGKPGTWQEAVIINVKRFKFRSIS
jgi:hypothetical protein